LNKIENDNITFDLLLSDVVLPDGRGTDLAYILTQDHPNLPVVLVTGYTDERADWDRAQEAGWPILQKPVSVSKLLESIREALDSPDYRR
ncbi:MAG: response regulator, partial [Candidatus Latescibacteria bacterium]|nr:response regulator [Candidatus Latescibacterota bacterium]